MCLDVFDFDMNSRASGSTRGFISFSSLLVLIGSRLDRSSQ